ncbi:MAG: ATP-binding protein, partial [Halobacteria archaeon]|nr:ATP-binding protein [Halobacteria archaeon]
EYLDQLQQRYPDTEFENNVPEDCSVEGHKLIPYAVKNVLENAVEHNDKEVPRVEVDLDESSPDGNGGFVTLRIADNGPGLPEEEKRVMEAGEEGQLEHSSGVGLWLVQWIVETSDGDISVEDREPDGTVVSMSLRRAEG